MYILKKSNETSSIASVRTLYARGHLCSPVAQHYEAKIEAANPVTNVTLMALDYERVYHSLLHLLFQEAHELLVCFFII